MLSIFFSLRYVDLERIGASDIQFGANKRRAIEQIHRFGLPASGGPNRTRFKPVGGHGRVEDRI